LENPIVSWTSACVKVVARIGRWAGLQQQLRLFGVVQNAAPRPVGDTTAILGELG